jgi:membrane protease YdiL (CAAX protease family)
MLAYFARGTGLGKGSINMTGDDASGQPASTQEGDLLARHPLISFFVMAYVFSWIAWSPWVLSEEGVGLLPFELSGATSGLLNVAAILLGPTLSGFIMTGITEGREGIRRLLRQIVLWRVGLRWYLFALIGIPVVMALSTLILPEGLASLLGLGPGYVLTYLSTYVLVVILGGPLFEEPGWRGFALPRLQPLHGPLVGTLILGLLWALWHLPEFLIPAWAESSGGSSFLAIVKFVLIATAFAILTTWVFNNTKGSVFMAILVHASIDTSSIPLGALFSPSDVGNSILLSFGVLALVLVAWTRGRLGYQHYHPEEADRTTALA